MPKRLLSLFSLFALLSFWPYSATCWWWRRSGAAPEPHVEHESALSAAEQFRSDASAWLGALATANPARRVRAMHVVGGNLPGAGPAWGVACGRLANDIHRAFFLFPPAAGSKSDERRIVVAMAEKYQTLAGEAKGAREIGEQLLQAGQGLIVRGSLNAAAEQQIAEMAAILLRKLRAIEVVPLFLNAATPVDATVAALTPFLTDPQTILIAFWPDDSNLEKENGAWRQMMLSSDEGEPPPLAAMPLSAKVAWGLAAELDWGSVDVRTASQSDPVGEAMLHLEPPVNMNLVARAAELNWSDQETKQAFVDATQAGARSDYSGAIINVAEKTLLLDLARRAISSHLENRQPPPLPVYSANLMRKHGCQLAVYQGEKMLGQYLIMPGQEPLAKAVVMNAAKFLKDDGDRPALTVATVTEARMAMGVLSQPETLQFATVEELYQKLAPGRHGVLLTADGKQAGFLPVVWKQVPEPEDFMAALARRVNQGLACLTKPDTKVEVFEMETFAEE